MRSNQLLPKGSEYVHVWSHAGGCSTFIQMSHHTTRAADAKVSDQCEISCGAAPIVFTTTASRAAGRSHRSYCSSEEQSFNGRREECVEQFAAQNKRRWRHRSGNLNLEDVVDVAAAKLKQTQKQAGVRLVMNAQRHVTRPPIILQGDKSHSGDTANMWKKVLCSDETKVELFGPNAKCCVWRKTLHITQPGSMAAAASCWGEAALQQGRGRWSELMGRWTELNTEQSWKKSC